jgi:hypothetical protein
MIAGAALPRLSAEQSLIIACRARGDRLASGHGDLIANLEYKENYYLLNRPEHLARRRGQPRRSGWMPVRSLARHPARGAGLRAAHQINGCLPSSEACLPITDMKA